MPAFDMLRNINDRYAVNSQNHIIDLLTGQDTGQVLTADIYQNILNGNFSPFGVTPAQNFTFPNDNPSYPLDNVSPTHFTSSTQPESVSGMPKSGGRLAGMFSGLRGRFGAGKSLFGGNVDLSGLKNLGSDIRATNLWKGGPTIGGAATAGMGIYQGVNAIKGLTDNANAEKDLDSLKRDIQMQVASNPMYDMYMDASDEDLLRKVNNNTLSNNWNDAFSGIMNGLPQAGLSALIGGVTGGLPGALVGGLGSLGNSAIQGYGKGTQETQAKLQGLYGRLRQANEEYRSMRRPAGLRRAGLSTQYYNQLY